MDIFEKWPRDDMLTTSDLRLKAVTLLTISTLARCSDLALANILKREQIQFNSDGSLTISLFQIKNDRDRTGFEIRVEKASNIKYGPVKTLNDYIRRTADPIKTMIKQTHPSDLYS